jgi:hypothetical protein
MSRMMLHFSSNLPQKKISQNLPASAPSIVEAGTADAILFRSNLQLDIDVCNSCFAKMSVAIKALLPVFEPIRSWSQRGASKSHDVTAITCDICGIRQRAVSKKTKADVAIALLPTMSNIYDVAQACEPFSWNASNSELRSALNAGGYSEDIAARLAELLLENNSIVDHK